MWLFVNVLKACQIPNYFLKTSTTLRIYLTRRGAYETSDSLFYKSVEDLTVSYMKISSHVVLNVTFTF